MSRRNKGLHFLHASKKNWPYENFWPVCLCVYKEKPLKGAFFFSPFFESFQVHSVGLVWWKKKSTKGSHSEKKTKKMGHFGVGGPSSLNHQTRPSRFAPNFLLGMIQLRAEKLPNDRENRMVFFVKQRYERCEREQCKG